MYVCMYVCMYAIYKCVTYIIYISRICMLKLLTLASANFHFSSARHPCCTAVPQRAATVSGAGDNLPQVEREGGLQAIHS